MNVTIKIKMKNVEVELTQQEALELRDILDKLCGGEKVVISTPYYVPVYPYPHPWYQGTWTVSSDNTTITTGGTFANLAINCECTGS